VQHQASSEVGLAPDGQHLGPLVEDDRLIVATDGVLPGRPDQLAALAKGAAFVDVVVEEIPTTFHDDNMDAHIERVRGRPRDVAGSGDPGRRPGEGRRRTGIAPVA
jgi:hypothetical protein